MNALLEKAEKWLNELGVQTSSHQTYLMVNRTDVEQFGQPDEVVKELQSFLGSKRVYWGYKDDVYLHLEMF
jgi:hypothetical protein